MRSTVCGLDVRLERSHFTGKERDTESGNDYFEARYYSSAMGRFMSPDWSAQEEPVPYAKLDDPQSLNLYAYVRNNPLIREDADGHNPGELVQEAEQSGIEPLVIAAGIVLTAMDIWDHRDAIGDAIVDGMNSAPSMPGVVPSNYWDAMEHSAQNQSSSPSAQATSTGQSTPANPNGQKGAPDHQAGVKEEADKARGEAGPGETVLEGKKVQGHDSTRRPDVQTVGADKKTKSIVEVERRPNSARNKAREEEYKKLRIPNTTKPIKKSGQN